MAKRIWQFLIATIAASIGAVVGNNSSWHCTSSSSPPPEEGATQAITVIMNHRPTESTGAIPKDLPQSTRPAQTESQQTNEDISTQDTSTTSTDPLPDANCDYSPPSLIRDSNIVSSSIKELSLGKADLDDVLAPIPQPRVVSIEEETLNDSFLYSLPIFAEELSVSPILPPRPVNQPRLPPIPLHFRSLLLGKEIRARVRVDVDGSGKVLSYDGAIVPTWLIYWLTEEIESTAWIPAADMTGQLLAQDVEVRFVFEW